jgi:hypothetical protein
MCNWKLIGWAINVLVIAPNHITDLQIAVNKIGQL